VDVLSDVITELRTGRPHSARTTRRAPWAIRHQRFSGAGFHLVLQGSCWLDTPHGPPITLGPGDLVFLPTGSRHALSDSPTSQLTHMPAVSLTDVRPDIDDPPRREPAGISNSTGPTVMLCGAYLMDQAASHPMLAELPETILFPSRLGQHRSLRAAIELLAGELDQPHPGGDIIVPALLDTLLLYALRAWFTEQTERHPVTGWAAALADPAIGAALRTMHDDPARPWTVAELASRAGLARATFARRFTTTLGQPPLTYLTWWRMTIATRLLNDSDLPLAAIARQTGYTSEFAFANAFKRAHGTAPGRYRRESRPHVKRRSSDTAP
jgi:AraC-like DNA-binding protein